MAYTTEKGGSSTGPADVAVDTVAGVDYQRVKLVDGTQDGTDAIPGSAADGLLVNLGANNDVVVSGSVTATGPLTDTQLRATPVPVSGTVTASGPLTDTQLRATPVPISGTVTGITNVVHVDDNSSTLSVDDGAGSLTVDGTVAVSSVAGNVTVVQGTAANLKVDASGVAVPVTDNGGNLSIDDGGNSITVDYATTGSGTATGALRVELPTNGTGVIATVGTITNVVHADDNSGSLTVDAPVTTPVFTRLSDGATALTTAGGRLSVDASGVAVPITDNAGSLTVDNAGTFAVQVTSEVPGTSATSLGKAEDAVAGDGDTGVATLAVRADIPTTLTSATGDYHFMTTDAQGRQWVRNDLMETLLLNQAEMLRALLIEIRITNVLLQSGLNVIDDPAGYRDDPDFGLIN